MNRLTRGHIRLFDISRQKAWLVSLSRLRKSLLASVLRWLCRVLLLFMTSATVGSGARWHSIIIFFLTMTNIKKVGSVQENWRILLRALSWALSKTIGAIDFFLRAVLTGSSICFPAIVLMLIKGLFVYIVSHTILKHHLASVRRSYTSLLITGNWGSVSIWLTHFLWLYV